MVGVIPLARNMGKAPYGVTTDVDAISSNAISRMPVAPR
jgi:hypothetical protein